MNGMLKKVLKASAKAVTYTATAILAVGLTKGINNFMVDTIFGKDED